MSKGCTDCTCLVTARISKISSEVQFKICEYVLVSSCEQTHVEFNALVGLDVFFFSFFPLFKKGSCSVHQMNDCVHSVENNCASSDSSLCYADELLVL